MRTLAFLLAIFCIAAASVPCTKEQTISYLGVDQNQAKQVDYAIVLDRSGSMQGEKIQNMKSAAKGLVANLPSTDRAAIISFNYEATLDQALTNDHSSLIASIDNLQASFSTKYAPPLQAAINELASSKNYKALIFLTDGASDFSEPPNEILALTRQLGENKVCIMTISYALGEEENSLLLDMASMGEAYGCGGAFKASEKAGELEAVFSRIHQTVSSLDALSPKTRIGATSFNIEVSSKINGKPVPGSDFSGCSQTPEAITRIEQKGELITEVNGLSGSLDLADGDYSYSTTALLSCSDGCDYIGNVKGNFSAGGECKPDYVNLATYVTGETQSVQITKTGFVPQTISGRQGTLVVWKNTDVVSHRVESHYFSQLIQPGASYTYVIGNVGTILYNDPDRNVSGSLSALSGAGTDLLLIIDSSGSMKGAGIEETKLAAQKFFNLLSQADRSALITFSGSAFLLQDFTSDRDALIVAANKLHAEGSTSYLSALSLASTVRTDQQGVLVFMSDGIPTDTQGEQAIIDATQELRAKGWCTMMVGFGEEGAQATSLLTRMAGGDECTAFLYAANGHLAETFGTIYQLSKHNNDLTFSSVKIPKITLSRTTKIQLQVQTKTGKLVPSGSDAYCAPVATVQASSTDDSVGLAYKKGYYTGEIKLKTGLQHISVIAAVNAEDDEGKVFTGTDSFSVLVISPVLALVVIVILFSVVMLWRKRAA